MRNIKLVNLPLCKCGCGKHVSKLQNTYVNGHWIRRKNISLKKYTIDFVRNYVANFDYKCLTEYYVNTQKIKMECPKSHIFEMRWDTFLSGCRCPKCSYNNKKRKFNEIKKYIEDFNYKLLSQEYEGCFTKLKIQCPENHIFEMRWDAFQQGGRCPECWNIKNCGSTHSCWQGGVTNDPYCDAWADNEYKKSIKERDNYICLNPCCFKQNNRLSIHHIDYNKKNCHPSNLITLCNSCNSRANKNREWHKLWYQILMNNRYEYQYLKEEKK